MRRPFGGGTDSAPGRFSRKRRSARRSSKVSYSVYPYHLYQPHGFLPASTETEKEEVFSWEDEDESEVQRTPKPSADNADQSASVTTLTALPTKDKSSPRKSEDSYDLVSSRSGNVSSSGLSPTASTRPLPPSSLGSAAPITAKEATNKNEGDDSDNSDWE